MEHPEGGGWYSTASGTVSTTDQPHILWRGAQAKAWTL